MPKKDKLICETCGQPAERLFQSLSNGRFECADCAILDAASPEHITARVARYIRKRNSARKNFGQVIYEPEAYAAAEEGRLFT